MPHLGEREQAWSTLTDATDTSDVAAKFRLSLSQIAEAAEVATITAHTRGAATPEPADLDLGARHASSSRLGELASQLDAALQLDRPRAPRPPARDARLDLGVPAPPRPRAHRVGLREDRRAHPGPEGPVRRRVGHRQDDGRRGARRRARPRAVPRRPRHDRLEVHRGDREEPRPHLRGRHGLQRDPVLRRGRRAVRQALRRLRRARPLRQHRGRLPAAEDGGLSRARSSSPPTSARTSTTRSSAGSTS